MLYTKRSDDPYHISPIVTTLTIMFVVDVVNAIYFMHESTIGFSFAKHIHRYITETYYNKMFGCCMY